MYSYDRTDPWLDVEQVRQVCPSCAAKMAGLGIRKIRARVLFGQDTREAAKWERLPKGWTAESLKSFWKSLTGRASKHKVSACIRKLDGKVDDPGAFCASLADRIEGKGWRSDR